MSLLDVLPAPHPAKWSAALLPTIREWLDGYCPVLDPMAGVGSSGIPGLVHGELEFPWAAQCPRPVVVSDANHLPFPDRAFSAWVSSFTYGNRMADQYKGDAKGSTRYTYRLALGQPLHQANTGRLQWGHDYREAHRPILAELWRVTRRGGLGILNISNHIRKDREEPVVEWVIGHMLLSAWVLEEARPIPTPRQRNGKNGEKRVGHEWLLRFRKPHNERGVLA